MLPEKDPRPTAPPANPSSSGADNPSTEVVANLSPEEQMARYEEALKESDWGHQPC